MSLVDPARSEAPSAVPPAASRTTIVVSLAAHAIVVLAVVVVPLFAQIRLPAPARPISAYVMAAAYEEVPLPAPPGRASTASVEPSDPAPAVADESTAAPVEAPQTIGSGNAPVMPPSGLPSGGVPGSGPFASDAGLPAPPSLAVPPSPAPPSQPLRVGGDIRAPRKLQHVAPVYPAIAAQARVSGTVILEATIAPTGEVVDVRVLRSVPLLDAAAVAAVRQWRYDAPRLNGTPVAVLLTVTVQFAQ
jgi:protein TonB